MIDKYLKETKHINKENQEYIAQRNRMTKKIVDGVDMGGCPSYIDNGECINENVYPDYCKACYNCTYKLEQQLDQLKAENENWQKEYWKLERGKCFLSEENDKFRHAIKQIKDIIYFNKTNRLSGGANISIEQILQTINEVDYQ